MNILPPPGPERRRQLALLSVLAIALVAYFGYQYWPKAAGASTSSNPREQASKTEKLPVPDLVDLTNLQKAPPGSDVGRNPFRFGVPPAPPPLPPQPYVQPVPETPVIRTPPAPQVPLQLLSLGKVTATNQRLINLLDPDSGTSWWVREGEVIDGKYKLVKVNADSVIVAFRDGTGQKPLYLAK